MAILGIAFVVSVFVSTLALVNGYKKSMSSAASDETIIILRDGANSEVSSSLSSEQIEILSNTSIVKRDATGQPLVSPEFYVVVNIPGDKPEEISSLPLRGVGKNAVSVRDNFKLVKGRFFEQGKREIIVGRSSYEKFSGLKIGDALKLDGNSWKIVGVFESKRSVLESEMWSDVHTLQQEYNRSNYYQSLRAKLNSSSDINALKEYIQQDPRLKVKVESEKDYLEKQSKGLSMFINTIGYPIVILMAIGSAFGAINTMYSSVDAKKHEIATIRAMGFLPFSIVVSILIESLVLALIGGLVGASIIIVTLGGYSVSTLSGSTLSQVVFDFDVSPEIFLTGLICAVVIGMISGLFPALKAVRVNVAVALKRA